MTIMTVNLGGAGFVKTLQIYGFENVSVAFKK